MGAANKYQKLENFFKLYTTLATSFLLALFVTSVFFPVLPSGAVTCANGSTGETGQVCDAASSDISVTVENPYYITVASSAGSGSGVSLNYTNDSGNNLGNVIAAADTVTTTSNTGRLKHLYISTTSSSSNNLISNNTDLDNNKTYIAAGGGDTIDTATALSDNTWGFALPSTTSGIPTNTFDTSYDASALSLSSKFTKVPTLGNDILIQEEIGTENAETGEYESTATVYYGTLATTDMQAGSYSNVIRYTAFSESPLSIPTMQEFTAEMCTNLAENTQTTLVDRRNGKAYQIVHALDGNCWMADNLSIYNQTISAEDSDFTTGTYTLPPSTNWGTNLYTQPKIHVATNSGYEGQVYYNWTAAVALQDGSTTAEQDQSICPKNWKLPKGGTGADDTTTNASWPKLINIYKAANGGTLTGADLTTTDTSAITYPLGFRLYYGYWYYYDQLEYEQGSFGTFWSSKPDSALSAHYFSYHSSSTSPYNGNYAKGNGFSVRCVSPIN